jgi:hypothetical protein
MRACAAASAEHRLGQDAAARSRPCTGRVRSGAVDLLSARHGLAKREFHRNPPIPLLCPEFNTRRFRGVNAVSVTATDGQRVDTLPLGGPRQNDPSQADRRPALEPGAPDRSGLRSTLAPGLSRREGMGLAQASTKDITVRSGLAQAARTKSLTHILCSRRAIEARGGKYW